MNKASFLLTILILLFSLTYIVSACNLDPDCSSGFRCVGFVCVNSSVGLGGQCGIFIPAFCSPGLVCSSNNSEGFGNCQVPDNSPIALVDPINGPAIPGQGFGVDNTVHGWACDKDWQAQGQSISVHIYIDTPAGAGQFPVVGLVANQASENAVALTCGSSQNNQRFSWAIPSKYYDGVQHRVYVYAIGKDSSGKDNSINSLASQSPQTFTIAPPVSQSANYCTSPTSYSVDYVLYNYFSDSSCSGAGQLDSGTKSFNCLYGNNCAEPFYTALTNSKDNREVYGGSGCFLIPSPFNSYAKAYSRSAIKDNGVYCSTGNVCQNNLCISSPTTPTTPTTCTSFTYSAFGICSAGVQSRTIISSLPLGCTGGTPSLTQSCTAAIGNSCTLNSQCSSNFCSGGICTTPIVNATTCTSFTYSAFGICSAGVQSRTIISSLPLGCTGGTPSLTQSCIDVTPPASVSALSVSARNISALISWTNPLTSDFSKVLIFLNNINIANVSSPLNSYNLSGLSQNTSYTVSVMTMDSSNNINASSINITFTTSTNGSIVSPPSLNSTPNSISNIFLVSVTQNSITISWTNPSSPSFFNNLIFLNGVNVLNTSSNTYTASSLSPNTFYTISIETQDSFGNVNQTSVSITTNTLPSSTNSGSSSSSSSSSSKNSRYVLATPSSTINKKNIALTTTGNAPLISNSASNKVYSNSTLVVLGSLTSLLILSLILLLLLKNK